MVTAAAVLGALIGGRLIALVDANALRKLFGWFVLLMASVMLAEEVDPAVGAAAAGTDPDRRRRVTSSAAGTRTVRCADCASRVHVGAAAT